MKVPLHDLLVELGGDMGEFAGFRTAMSYGDPLGEHMAVRETLAVFDISHMGRILVEGESSFELLNKLLPKDLSKSKNQRMFGPTAFLNENGGFKDDVMLYRFDEDKWLIVCNAINRDKVLRWLNEWIQRLSYSKISVRDLTLEKAMLAVQGPQAKDYIAKIRGLESGLSLQPLEFISNVSTEYGLVDVVSRSGWTGEDGFEIIGDPSVIGRILKRFKELGVRLAGLIARDTLRLEMGYVLYGNDINEEINPYEARYWVFDKEKRDCVGCEALKDFARKGVSRVRYGIRMKKGSKMIPRTGYEIVYEGETIGYVTSGGYSPYLERGIGMGYIRSSHALPGLDVEIRFKNRSDEARILDFPLIKK
ncbi:MAG: glycine cleavage system aminomethyltransferase GcvT [Sulfolobales archaeon]